MSTVIPPRADKPPHADKPVRTPRAVTPMPTSKRPRPSNVTLKVTMALTGTVFALFVLVHMIGNLKVYTGPGHFDDYAHWLRTLLEPLLPYEGMLWIFRAVLALCLVLHVGASFILIGRSHKAKGRFRRKGMSIKRLPATLMPYTGLVLLIFIVFHILDLTTGTRPAASDHFVSTTETSSHAYHNLVESLQRWPVAAFYILVMVLLGTHLVHGLWSVVNDLGATGHRTRRLGALVALVVAAAVMIGNISIPIAVLAGLVS
ncbi:MULTISPECIES: succinate dehydrogenase cytochrome b subunit [Gordonia]|uniref:Putative succinate dehydrogenase cytochrome b subunit n=1 Tax=Gordonia sputi NBRC 100414 TaxID=1089453 RepID=H5TXV4_9ACTN|nr:MULTISPECIES: succinate dehydrogenase cytochrome b subunit [Gordonia]NKY91942.1 succinate dehydrogenase cytochrome b subunit [Gordonia sputi]GAB38312.1 putative succinate dehydrogenase cytochrome b subunit [Gordonia sputi NBRC 100414]